MKRFFFRRKKQEPVRLSTFFEDAPEEFPLLQQIVQDEQRGQNTNLKRSSSQPSFPEELEFMQDSLFPEEELSSGDPSPETNGKAVSVDLPGSFSQKKEPLPVNRDVSSQDADKLQKIALYSGRQLRVIRKMCNLLKDQNQYYR